MLIALNELDLATRLRVTGALPPHAIPQSNLLSSLLCPNSHFLTFFFSLQTLSFNFTVPILFLFSLLSALGKQNHFLLCDYAIFLFSLFYSVISFYALNLLILCFAAMNCEIKIENLAPSFLHSFIWLDCLWGNWLYQKTWIFLWYPTKKRKFSIYFGVQFTSPYFL